VDRRAEAELVLAAVAIASTSSRPRLTRVCPASCRRSRSLNNVRQLPNSWELDGLGTPRSPRALRRAGVVERSAARLLGVVKLAGHTRESVPRFSSDDSQVVSASYDGTVLLWDLKSGRPRVVPTLAGAKFVAAIDATGKRIAIAGNTPLVFKLPTGALADD
jgi:WD40 repeat protein